MDLKPKVLRLLFPLHPSNRYVDISGLRCLADLHGKGDIECPKVRDTYADILEAIIFERSLGGNAGWTELFRCYTRRTIVGITSQMFAQLNGINALLYFLPENLTRAGFDVANAYVLLD